MEWLPKCLYFGPVTASRGGAATALAICVRVRGLTGWLHTIVYSLKEGWNGLDVMAFRGLWPPQFSVVLHIQESLCFKLTCRQSTKQEIKQVTERKVEPPKPENKP